MRTSYSYRSTGQLGLRHAVPGIISYTVIALSVFGVLIAPRAWVFVATVFLGYFIMRIVVTFVFALAGDLRIATWERTDWTAEEDEAGSSGFAPADVWHLVLVPTYREPEAVLRRTLDGLATQHRASERLIVVIAMEEREPGSQEKGNRLAADYHEAFAHIVASVHPAGLPGEIAGKSSNMLWATRAAKEAVLLLDVDPARTTVTSCDADSILHPLYFAAVSRLFVHDDRRHARFWQAPLLYYNNIWRAPAPVRFTTWVTHATQIAELAFPGYIPLPISTYTLSFRLAEECGWWDPAVISEDWHIFLQCEVARDGDVGMTSVFLPTRADAAEGDGFWSGIRTRARQVMRHAYGAEDAGYLIGELITGRCVRSPRMLARTGQVLHDHVLRVASWFLVLSAYVLNVRNHPVHAAAHHSLGSLPAIAVLLGVLFACGGTALAAILLLELRREPPPSGYPVTLLLAELTAMWFLLPIIGLVLGMAPALRAQSKLMSGRPLFFEVTPKRAARVPDTT